MRRTGRCVVLALLLSACGSSGAARTGGASSDGGAGEAAMSVDSAPTESGVDGASRAGAIDGGAPDSTGDATLTDAADASMGDAVSDAAPIDDSASDAAVDAPLVPGTVRGQVVGPAGNGLVNVPVIVAGQSVHTDSMGQFTATQVTAPYDLIVGYTVNHYVVIFQGLTRWDPVVSPPSTDATKGSVKLTALLQGSYVSPQPPNMQTEVDAFSATLSDWGQLQQPTGSPFSWTLAWYGPSQGTLDLVALQFVRDNSLVATSFPGFALVKQAVSDGQALSIPLPLAPPTTSTLSGTATAPSGFAITAFSLSVHDPRDPFYPDRISFTQQGVNPASAAASFSYLVPNLGPDLGTTLTVTASSNPSAGTQVSDSYAYFLNPTSPVAVTLLAASVLTSPKPPLGTPQPPVTPTSTPFSWTAVPNSAYQVTISPNGGQVGTLIVYTNSTSMTLPDLTSVGMAWTSGATYSWQVMTDGPATVDDLATFRGQIDAQLYRFPLNTFTGGWQFAIQ